MEAPWLAYWDSPSMSHYARSAPSLDPTPLEQALLQSFLADGRDDLVSAFMKRRKYSRAWRSVEISASQGSHDYWRRREAFLGKEAVQATLDEFEDLGEHYGYEAFVLQKYGDDEGFKAFMARTETKWRVAKRWNVVTRSENPLSWSECESEGEDDSVDNLAHVAEGETESPNPTVPSSRTTTPSTTTPDSSDATSVELPTKGSGDAELASTVSSMTLEG